MTDPGGKARRVVGVFAILIGASLILDAQAWRIGGGLVLLGAAAMLWGLLASARRRSGRTSTDGTHAVGEDLR